MSEETQTPSLRLPLRTSDAKEFWDGCLEGEIRIQQCVACGRKQFYPRPFCTACGSEDLDYIVSAGLGTVHAYSICHRTTMPELEPRIPYSIVLVDLDEGVRLLGNVLDKDPEEVRIGMRVRVTFEHLAPDVAIPQFVSAAP